MRTIRDITAPILAVLLCAPTTIMATAVAPQDLVGTWQVGLSESARKMPVGAAFTRGFTAGVMRLNSDGSLVMEAPCQNDEFNKKIGGPMEMKGTWNLSTEGVLTTRTTFRGHEQVMTGSVTIQGREMRIAQNQGKELMLGRFLGDTHAKCADQ